MRSVKTWQIVLAVAILALIALIAWRIFGVTKSEAEPTPVALVTTAMVQQGRVSDTVSAFGVITAAPAASRSLTAPRDGVVERVLVVAGQSVAAGTPLLILVDTPQSAAAARQAGDAVGFAQKDLARVQRLYDEHIDANDQLNAAKKVLADARTAQISTGAGGAHQSMTAPFTGIITATPVASGEHVAPGATLITLAPAGAMSAQLSIEPSQAARLAPGQNVNLTSPFDPAWRADGRLTIVGHQIDPASRLVTAWAALSIGGVPLGAPVKGQIEITARTASTVPREAVVFDEAGAHIFVVGAGKAHSVAITPGAPSGDQIEVSGGPPVGTVVAVSGAYQLEDGMAVRTAKK